MDDELTPEQKFAAEDPETLVPRRLMQGARPEEVVAELVRLDWTPEAAWALVERVEDDLRRFYSSPESRQRLVSEARREFVVGTLVALLGVGCSVLSFLLAFAGIIPAAILAAGTLFTGLAIASRGWARWRLYRRGVLPFEHPGPPDAGQDGRRN
jgi:hypothetical protein